MLMVPCAFMSAIFLTGDNPVPHTLSRFGKMTLSRLRCLQNGSTQGSVGIAFTAWIRNGKNPLRNALQLPTERSHKLSGARLSVDRLAYCMRNWIVVMAAVYCAI